MTNKKHPKGLYLLFTVEMWERFNYYGMRAILTLFMVSSVIGFEKSTASQVYGWFTALVYLTPLLGGYLADRFIGKRHSVTIGALVMATGQFTLASYEIIPPIAALVAGLTLIIIGNGFFKPNISSIVGELYEPNDSRRDRAFTIFYMGINLGALIAPFVCGSLGQAARDADAATAAAAWKYGFMAAGMGMILGLIVYLSLQKRFLGDIGLHPQGANSKGTINRTPTENAPLSKDDKDRIKAIFVFTFFAVFFFAFFEQAGTSLTFFADEATRLPSFEFDFSNINIFNWEKLEEPVVFHFRSSFFQSINPVFVLILAPLFSLLWKWLGRREPSIPNKFGWGLLLQGIAFAVIAVGASVYLADGKPVSMLWLVALYFFCTTGELCLSPIGLSMVTKLAPVKFMSLLMGVWLMSSFFGNLLAGFLASYYEELELTSLFSIPAALSVVFAVFMWLMTRKMKAWMHGVK
ncbi:MAG: peptide MFS transporter [Prevotellaceae bacterium]|jgi:POT family proton-dependent oligopeptide transporter|nr:peptide MFS transporter [Prevotellaceae bacterium]